MAIFIGLARLFIFPQIFAKRQYAMILKAQNADKWVDKFTFSDEIICESGNTHTSYAYSDIINITEDSQYFYLFYNDDMVLRIYKAGFILGTADAFREFCKEFRTSERIQKEVCYKDEVLGEFKLCKGSNRYEADFQWLGDKIGLCFHNESIEKNKMGIRFLRELAENQVEWDKKIRDYAAAGLVSGANEWNEGQNISENEIKNRITLIIINVDSEGVFEFWFDDDNIFLGHTVIVSGDMRNGPSAADIAG